MMTSDKPTNAAAEVKLADSAGALKDSAEQQNDSAHRTILAAERTYAAWVRTGVTALAFGIGARALLEKLVPGWLTGATGTALILFSGFCFVAAVWREMDTGAPPPRPDTRKLPSWLLLGANGSLLLMTLAAPVGVRTSKTR